ncbi:hypothetical protein, partial [Kitasatospora sp. LaBMicrA B282]|uniref:hypothetical protein n=1 Tax=Kitasatospora sp. LaBMicrA B282 TaxID=3420949 RepID=UPI003D0E9115
MTYEETAVLLLRRLTGRLDDDTLDSLWGYAGAGEWAVLEDTLLAGLEYWRTPVTPAEIELLATLPDDPAALDVAKLAITDRVELAYAFLAGPPVGAAPAGAAPAGAAPAGG